MIFSRRKQMYLICRELRTHEKKLCTLKYLNNFQQIFLMSCKMHIHKLFVQKEIKHLNSAHYLTGTRGSPAKYLVLHLKVM